MPDKGNKGWDGKSRGGRWGHLFFVQVIRLFGVRTAYIWLALIAIHFIPFAPKATKASWLYHRKRRGLGVIASMVAVYRHYYVFGQTLIDKVAIRSGLADKYSFEFDNYQRFLEIINSGTGVVMIGAHVGCWEAGAGFFGKYGKHINIVMMDAEHQQIKEVIEKSGQAGEYKIIPVGQDPLGMMIQIRNALDRGEYVCFNGDRFTDAHSTQTADLLGATAELPIGPFRIAAKCRVPVVFHYAMREPGRRYRFIFEEATPCKPNDYAGLMQQYAISLERTMKRYPLQWFNFYNYWND